MGRRLPTLAAAGLALVLLGATAGAGATADAGATTTADAGATTTADAGATTTRPQPGLSTATTRPRPTTTTTRPRPRPPRAFSPSVSPSTIANRAGCGQSTTATVSTGTTGDAKRVTFRVQVGGRTTSLYASGSGSRWSATLNGSAFGPDSGSGTIRAIASGPGGSSESGPTGITIVDCRS